MPGFRVKKRIRVRDLTNLTAKEHRDYTPNHELKAQEKDIRERARVYTEDEFPQTKTSTISSCNGVIKITEDSHLFKLPMSLRT